MIHRTHRFHGRKSLGFVLKRGQIVPGPLLSLKYIYNQRSTQYRVAVVVSRKVSKSAIVRNRIRRRIYETVREVDMSIEKPFDLVFLVREADLAKLSAHHLRSAVLDKLIKANVLAVKQGSASDEKHDILGNKEKNR